MATRPVARQRVVANDVLVVSATINTTDWEVVGETDPPGYKEAIEKSIAKPGVFLGNKNNQQAGGEQAYDLVGDRPIMWKFTYVGGEAITEDAPEPKPGVEEPPVEEPDPFDNETN